jgi:hypothetical protein
VSLLSSTGQETPEQEPGEQYGIWTHIADADWITTVMVTDGVERCALSWTYAQFDELIEALISQRDKMWRMRLK